MMEPNVKAAMAYAFPILSGVALYSMEKENKFIRFHSFQSILFWVVTIGAFSIASSLKPVLIGFLLMPLVQLITVMAWVWLKRTKKRNLNCPFWEKSRTIKPISNCAKYQRHIKTKKL